MQFEALNQIYATIPTFICKIGCTDCCGPNFWAKTEWLNILTWLKARGKTERFATGMDCPYIENNQCSIYEVRPIICRLFGVVDKLQCPYGCAPAKLLSGVQATGLLRQVASLEAKRIEAMEDVQC